MARIGILGGTFNPPHVGHLVLAQQAYEQLGLDEIVFMPVATPPHKEPEQDPGAEHRVALSRLATAPDERLRVSELEVERGGASYTVDTLRQLSERQPGDELVLLVGGDMAASLPRWREPERVLELATLAVAERTGDTRDTIDDALGSLRGAPERVTYFSMPRIDVSSTLVRDRVARGLEIRHLVPDAVADYIATHGLYRAAAVSA